MDMVVWRDITGRIRGDPTTFWHISITGTRRPERSMPRLYHLRAAFAYLDPQEGDGNGEGGMIPGRQLLVPGGARSSAAGSPCRSRAGAGAQVGAHRA